jgi:hypothetical protein
LVAHEPGITDEMPYDIPHQIRATFGNVLIVKLMSGCTTNGPNDEVGTTHKKVNHFVPLERVP